MISFQKVSKTFQSRLKPIHALEEVSFEVQPGEFVSIVGRSGSGKTTLLKLLLAEEDPSSGAIFFNDQDIHQIKSDKLHKLRREIGVVFQDYKLFPSKTTYENIAYVMEVMGASDREIKNDVAKVLELVQLTDRKDSFPEELSGGERQRAAIARALIHRPQVILADEPTGNLDPYHTRDIIKLLVKLNEMGTTIILATHNQEVINSLEKRVITLEEGKVIRDEKKGRFAI
ncbi:MAG: cell division ATP-binding protein FtsE [Candidatus Nealsonbacteria bacterium RIFCSPLOWO2_01_FULL_43_32]|uniref:Cell division ATP-binding protein FtsE n=1 Tax=Candidatus Nealsonbacteria bacterium RIFCSPLOWO2_01_FULL_43_32 TaxID=1801672 RepID=A0A1G2EF10_9BACT|nr:MAG: cell division ATP-binding protein FtsE [Candidatus Nealsonbacteria bacterium RIFCSPLOWO2_01_FULL_43_32]